MHFDAAFHSIPNRFMNKAAQVEIRLEFPVHPRQQIQVESRLDIRGIVVGGQHPVHVFHKIRSDQEQIAWPQPSADFAKEVVLFRSFQISDSAAEEQEQKLRLVRPPAVEAFETLEIIAVYDFDRRKFTQFPTTSR